MRRTISLVLIVLAACFFLQAQEPPKVEIFGGYSLARITDQGVVQKHIFNNRWNSEINFNFDKHLGIVGDFGGYYGTHTGPSFTQFTCFGCPITFPGPVVTTQFHTFLFGPQVSARVNSFTPFGHVLFGAIHAREDASAGVFPPFTVSASAFAFAVGGGLDTSLSHRIAWRVQADYLGTRLFDIRENNLRVSTGVVFRFGD